MHTRASNSKLVEPLAEPKRTLNHRLRRRNRVVPIEQKDERSKNPREVYPPVIDINHFLHFLNLFEIHDPMANPDDEPMWVADCVVPLTPGPVITILETANEFAIKGKHLTLIKGNQFYGRIKTDPHKHVHKFLSVYDMFKYRETEKEVVRLMMFPLSLTGEAKTWLDELNESFGDQANNNSDTDIIMARMDAITMKMDPQYKEMKSRSGCNHCGGMPNYDRFLKELVSNKHKLEQISLAFFSDESSAIIQNKVAPKLGDPGSFLIPSTFSKTFSCNALADLCATINLMT
ncbi:hypothetical protein Tco_0883471, partial [Tanacetum coccineum]